MVQPTPNSAVPLTPEEILSLIPRFADARLEMTPLAGGITNRNWRVQAGCETFVLRVAGENTAVLGIDRRTEHACSLAAAELDVGAEVVAHLPEHHALVTRFLDGRVLKEADAADPSVLTRIVRSLRRYHESPAGAGRFCGFTTIRAYERLAREHRVPVPPEVPDTMSQLAEIETTWPAMALCPCHNDLLPANLIDDGHAVRIIDWEYAGMGDRWFDLGNLADNHRLDGHQEERLLAEYFGDVRGERVRRLRAMRRVSALREAMWGFVQAGVSSLDFDFIGYAKGQLERFQGSQDAPPV